MQRFLTDHYPLVQAVKRKSLDTAASLIRRGISANVTVRETPEWWAEEVGVLIVRTLVDRSLQQQTSYVPKYWQVTSKVLIGR